MPIEFDRSICCDLNETIAREWLITNNVGGYAAGTVAGVLTRMEHGLLVAEPPTATSQPTRSTPHLLVAKMDEEIVFDQRTYYLGTNEYRDGTLNPSGFVHLETFRLEEGFPIFTYHLGGIDGIMLEKRIWMPQGQHSTYIQYRVKRTAPASEYAYNANGPYTPNSPVRSHNDTGYGRYYKYSETTQRELTLTLLPFSAYRPYNQPQHGSHDWHLRVESLARADSPEGVAGCTIQAWEGAHPYHIVAVGHSESQTTFIPTNVWYWNFLRRQDRDAGRPSVDDLYLPGVLRAKLWPAEDCVLTIILTAEELSTQTFNTHQLNHSYRRAVENQQSLLQPQRYFGEGGETTHPLHVLPLPTAADPHSSGEEYLRLLLQAANRFIIHRSYTRNDGNRSPLFFNETEKVPVVLDNYYGMTTSTRETLIALPGLLLATGRHEEAERILRRIARFFKQGLLPDYLPLSPLSSRELTEADYGNVDVTLWYLYALDAYVRSTHDEELLSELYPRLASSIDWYIQGTLNGIQCDSSDGLLRANAPGKALTWMNATVNGQPVTPRGGKPVEVNALWYNALFLMREWTQFQYRRGRSDYGVHPATYYEELATRCRQSFQQLFWNAEKGYLFDVVSGPDGNDDSLRPNQLLALSLRYPVLKAEHRQAVFEQVTQHLLTPVGLRTLNPEHEHYRGQLPTHYEEHNEQQAVLHQGAVWPWLLGPYIEAMLNMQKLSGELRHLYGMDSDLPHEYLWRKSIFLLEPFRKQLETGMLGTIGGVFAGDVPHEADALLTIAASAVSIGEILRMYHHLTQHRIQYPANLISAHRQ